MAAMIRVFVDADLLEQFHQVVRAATPIFITFLSMSILGAHFSNKKMVTLLVVILGVALA